MSNDCEGKDGTGIIDGVNKHLQCGPALVHCAPTYPHVPHALHIYNMACRH